MAGLTADDVVQQTANASGQHPDAVRAVLPALADLVASELRGGHPVAVPGLGTFRVDRDACAVDADDQLHAAAADSTADARRDEEREP